MQNVAESLLELFVDLVELVGSVGYLVLPWTPLVAWLVFWLLAVNWTKFRVQVTQQGGWISLLLIAFVWILVWGVVAPPASGSYHLFGLTISNFVGKTVYVTGLYCLMLLAGAAQLSGCCASCCQFAEEVPEADDHHGHDSHGHGHDDHGSHGGDHGGHH